MVAKLAVRRGGARLSTRRKAPARLRVGVIVGKVFDPIPQGTQDRNFPRRFKVLNNTGPRASGWGGMFQIDAAVALRVARLHPDLLAVDIIPAKELSAARLRRNHVTLNFFYDVVMATYAEGRARGKSVHSLFRNPRLRMWPSYNYYDWVCTKPRYMKQCKEAGIPIIDTIFVEGGLQPARLLRQIRAKGWDRCFIKAASYVCFGNGACHGRTQDWIDDPSILQKFASENREVKDFLVQPYTLKPNGKVFDEVRNFFINGQWSYSVYTDGTDDDAVYEQKPGPLKEATRHLSERAFAEVLKVADWHGKSVVPLVCRIDVGVVPDRTAPKGFRVFLNEIECEISTWLPRYCPFNLCHAVADAAVSKSVELVERSLDAGRRLPDAADLRRIIQLLKVRLDGCGGDA
uniref:ATP-grasp domain-containing protein n=1 Tax=Zooxanthella nutricula TaxID=1333877 RepID=A0A6U6SD51_9DINO